MNPFIIFVFGMLGLIVGSFLNVVILRFNTGKSINGRSGCFSCGKQLKWHELVPVFSFLFLQGKCSSCKSAISIQYPLVEIGTALLFALAAFLESNPLSLLLTLICFSLLVIIIVYDLRHTVIPDLFSFLFGFFALARLILLYQWQLLSYPHVFDLFAGPIIALPFFLFWLFSKGRWMGLGDSKLALGIGWFLGLASALSAVCLAFWIGAAVSVAILLIQKSLKERKHLTWKSEVPFAPFLVLGLLIAYLIHIDIFSINAFLSLW